MLKKIIKEFIPSPCTGSYYLGFINKDLINANSDWFNQVKWMNTNGFEKEGWFADPFFYLVNDNEIVLLAEQLYYPINRGRLVKLTLDKDFNLQSVKPILTLDTHLSFPYIWTEEGCTYIIPENHQGGNLSIWDFDGEKMSNPQILIPEALNDSQLVKLKDEYFIFAVKHHVGAWAETRHLHIWKSKNLLGPYQHIQTISNTGNYERGAGGIVVIDTNTILRPAQSCDGAYGKEVILFKMTYDGTQFLEEEIERISPLSNKKYGEALHTYNVYGGLCVIDGFEHQNRLLYKLCKKLFYRNKEV